MPPEPNESASPLAGAVARVTGFNQRVLEVGSRGDATTKALVDNGCAVVGVVGPSEDEDTEAAAKWCERVVVTDLDAAGSTPDLGDERFDVVVVTEALATVNDAKGLLAQLRRVLDPGGYVVAAVPDLNHPRFRDALADGNFPYNELGLDDDAPPRRFFTRPALIHLLESAELTPVYLTAAEGDDDHLVVVATPVTPRGALGPLLSSVGRDRDALAEEVAALQDRVANPEPAPATPATSSGVIDFYVRTAPSPQTAVDIFKGDWSSQLPDGIADTGANRADLFDDPRVTWAINELGGVEGARVLELGPLEGGHSHMLMKAGAKSVVSIEANTRAFLKCLIVKELLGLDRVQYLCGDFVEYLRNTDERFDVCFASGVLYHMQNPAELLELTAKVANGLYLWSHYWDADLVAAKGLTAQFPSSTPLEHKGFEHVLHRHEYGIALEWTGFCGAGSEATHWLSRDDLMSALNYFGWTPVAVGCEQPDHPNGPCLAVVATSRRG